MSAIHKYIDNEVRQNLYNKMLTNFQLSQTNDLIQVCYGAGEGARNFINNCDFINIDQIIETKTDGNKFIGARPVLSSDFLNILDPNKTLIYIASSNFDQITNNLISLNFKKAHHRINSIVFSKPMTHFTFQLSVRTEKALYQILESFGQALAYQKLNEKSFYLVLNHTYFDQLVHLLLKHTNENGGNCVYELNISLDQQKLTPSVSLPLPDRFFQQVLKGSVKIGDSYMINNSDQEIIKLYLSLFMLPARYESANTGRDTGGKIDLISALSERGVSTSLEKMRLFERQLYYLGFDTYKFRMSLSSVYSTRTNREILFVARESFIKYDCLSTMIDFLDTKGLKFKNFYKFNEREKLRASTEIRNGIWDDTESEVLSGFPIGFLFFQSETNMVVQRDESSPYVYRTRGEYDYKNEIRSILRHEKNVHEPINFIHSPDDELEAGEYKNILDNFESN